MKDNHLPQALYWVTYSVIVLFLLSALPASRLGEFSVKPIDLLADVKPTVELAKQDTLIDTVVFVPQVVTHKVDSCKKGVFCIEDYSPDGKAMAAFVSHMKASKERPIRIAFFGDSFVEGDILTMSLRDTLQRLYGGRGVGFVPITSEVAKFRTTIKHTFTNWKTYSIVSSYEEEPRFGIGGFVFEPEEGNTLVYSPGYGGRINRMSLLYSAKANRLFDYTVNDTVLVDSMHLAPTQFGRFDLGGLQAKNIQLNFQAADSLQLYGVCFEEGNGVYVDNLAMRGNSGIGLGRISGNMLREAQRVRPYSLIILQFGLNVVGEHDSISYSGYVESMVRVVNRMKESFTDCSFLLLSVSDRSSNQNGKFKTIPGILMMRQAQRLIAKKTGIAFWDLFQAMGGENSMPKFVNAKPAMAARDFTHLNFKGGKYVARQLSNALLYEQERYAKANTAF